MKMRYIKLDKKGVSNVLGYLLSFLILTMLSVSTIYLTNSLIDDKVGKTAGLEAQQVANKVAYGIIEAITKVESNPNSDFEKTLDIPVDLAGLNYYIDITDNTVYVNSTNGRISKTSPVHGSNDAQIFLLNKRIYPSYAKIVINVEKPDYVYKFDFGEGNSTSHSPVETGYYMVTNETQQWLGFNNYYYRIPISVSNPSSNDLNNVAVKITLDPNNFDYQHANVNVVSSTLVQSDLVFYDPSESVQKNRPYFIDYWNPTGESIVYVNLSIEKSSYKYVYLYYGDKTGMKVAHTMSEISLLFDDFGGSLDSNKWDDGVGTQIIGSNITFSQGEYITSEYLLILTPPNPTAKDDSVNISNAMYIVETKMKIENNGQARLCVPLDAGDYYQLYLNNTSPSNLSIKKSSTPVQWLQNTMVSKLKDWLRTKTYVYISKNCYNYEDTQFSNATFLNNYVYNFSTFAYIGNVSGLDTDPDVNDDATGAPYMGGKIRLINSGVSGDVTVDWIRVMKIPPEPLTVDLGIKEIKEDIGFKWNVPSNINVGHSSTAGFADPVLCDFNSGDTDEIFTVEDLPEGTYTIGITIGDYEAICEGTIVSIDSNPVITIPATAEPGEFKTKWLILDWQLGGDLGLKFSSPGTWQVNSMTIQQGEKGINIEEGGAYG
jgi:hypothetical protein